MQLITLFFVSVAALASTAAAMPHLSAANHGARILVHVPTNATDSHNTTTTGTQGKAPLLTGSSHTNRPGTNRCHELCSLQSQTCTIAVPDDDKFW
ncbi:inosine-uridine preferring nucleoside hydrolase [Penicillium digitatum]|uniref:Inosine-uridine preferring nucleoside hydrolase n=1 Tax=Penicillium digitatum TaxID=36651 RepID=A0A7T6XTS0_PENDI|nr:inosine-uridine preferring nucleoside hydrolase [Penicillium digitatum]